MPAKLPEKLIKLLGELYPEPASELHFKDAYQLVVAVLLSAQCTDKKVNQVTPLLFAPYPNFLQLSAAECADVEAIIRPINYYRTKAKHLVALAGLVVNRYHGALPRTHSELISLPGVGNKTANVVLSELGISHTFPVDTHVFRVSKRLGLAAQTASTPLAVEKQLMAHLPKQHVPKAHHWLILHGRYICKAQTPRCGECPLTDFCLFYEKTVVKNRIGVRPPLSEALTPIE